jgi:hypothetical protein
MSPFPLAMKSILREISWIIALSPELEQRF